MNATMEDLTLRLTFTTDWHVGTGAGRAGSVDRLVARDADGLPFVPAKSLVGIWRDACEGLAMGLDGDGGDDPGASWAGVVEDLFGSQPALNKSADVQAPRKARLSIHAPRFPAPLARRLAGIESALTFVKPGVMIDARSGRAADQHLRFEEMVRRGAVLEADAVIDLTGLAPERAKDVRALLLAGTKLVERLGGKRRRGAGKLTLTVERPGNAAVAEAIAWLEQRPLPTPRPSGTNDAGNNDKASEPSVPAHTSASGADFIHVPVTITLDSPLSVSHRTLGNVVKSLDFLPGSSLLPLVTRACAAAGIDVRAMIRAGDLRVSTFTPEMNGRRCLPAPFVLERLKDPVDGEKETLLNRLWPQNVAWQTKALSSGFLDGTADTVRIVTITPTLRTHNTIDDNVQRPTTTVGGLYTYAAIPAGTTLSGDIQVRGVLSEKVDAALIALNGRKQRLGRSKKDDYGAVTLTVGASAPVDPAVTAKSDGRVVLWCQSDVLLRSPTLRPATTARDLARALAAALGNGFTVTPSTAAAIRTRRIDTWHERWGLPRPSLVAIQAGSCAVFTVAPAPDGEALRRIAVEGLGERRAEGFGAIAINPDLLDRPTLTEIDPTPHNPDLLDQATLTRDTDPAPQPRERNAEPTRPLSKEPLSKDESAFLTLVRREAWRSAMHRAAQLAGANADLRGAFHLRLPAKPGDLPRMSQLGNLRAVLAELRSAEDRARVADWFSHLREVKQRSKRWPPATLAAFEELVTKPDRVWRLLEQQEPRSQQPFLIPPPLADGDTDDASKADLWADAVRALFEAVFHNHKRALDGQPGGDADHVA